MRVTLEDIQKAREILKPIIHRTELGHSLSASKLLGTEVFLKFENTQRTGSFKIRGAYNKIFHLSEAEKKKGVVASSAGNHAQGVALSASLAGVKATIVMPENAPLSKVEATQEYGAKVILKGEIYDEAYEEARRLEKVEGYTFVHPYEDPHVIAGQGTIGLEICEALEGLDSLVIPIGGGGLISGIATAVKVLKPQIKIYGVQSIHAPGMSQLFHGEDPALGFSMQGVPKRVSTIADGIAIKRPSQCMYESFINPLVDEVITVNDDEIAGAIVFLLERAKTLTEGSGAAAFAAAMKGAFPLGKRTCIFLSGGNIDLNVLSKVIEKGQTARGRLVELSVVVDDLPGNLAKLTNIIAQEKANVLDVKHDRIRQGLYLRETKIDFILETTNSFHVEKLKAALQGVGARIL